MNRSTFLRLILGALGTLGIKGPSLRAAPLLPVATIKPPVAAKDRSLQLEIEHAIEKGLYFLQSKQDRAGFWSIAETPGLSALVLTAFVKEPSGAVKARPPEFVQKGYDYLTQCQQADGGIYVKGLANYNTSVAMLALVAADAATYAPALKRARNFISGLQGHYPPGSEGEAYDGGLGYDPQDMAAPRVTGPSATPQPAAVAGANASPPASHLHYDVSNTSFAMEALHETRFLKDSGSAEEKDLDWSAAVAFLQRCQNLPSNHQAWVKTDEKNLGGFVYDPLNKKAHSSYGSMSYAGLLSYIHADLKKEDPRVAAVYEWLRKNYTLEENPGMGADGLFYYYHVMTKALSAYGAEGLTLADGKQVNWCNDLTLKLLNLQQGDGSWANTSGRWWEKDPVLVTAYAVRTLEAIHPQV